MTTDERNLPADYEGCLPAAFDSPVPTPHVLTVVEYRDRLAGEIQAIRERAKEARRG